ncbi:hypothetical protein BZG13_05540 [Salinivibrio sp. ML323]|uniref:hypothetical protein n=1 Tax=Salinivibrio sp. ML323 TaxID=1909474 RepID=UPI000984FC1B|nr:hypothetical protein [Salinivibrio sp. ML323]OOE58928.1 hypothetical protein BZG13_05540 [Salinivibrio sp. ML323]
MIYNKSFQVTPSAHLNEALGKGDNLKYLRTIFFIVIGCSGLLFSFLLLVHGYLNGSEFVAFSFGIALLSLITAFWKDVSELSIGGNIIKLREVKSELEDTVLGLKSSTIEMLKMHIKLVRNPVSDGFYYEGGNKDERIDNFWYIYEVIKDLDIEKELANELKETLDVLLRNQLFSLGRLCRKTIHESYPTPFDSTTQLPATRDLQKLAVKDVESNISVSGSDKSPDAFQDYVLDGVEHYDRLLKLSQKFA